MKELHGGAFFASIFWVLFMCEFTTPNFRVREDAIKHGAAHYDSRTGEFTWNDEVKL